MPEEDDKAGRLRSRILSINRDAARFFFQCLNADNDEARTARAYWRSRGLSDSTIRRFGLGYAPSGFSAALHHLKSKGYTEEELLASGIVKRSAKGNVYDAFFGRVMTPIFDLRGNIIAFGGRVLGDAKPKYVNTGDTPVYKKSRAMFALNLAKKSTSRRYILCEGYMDVISLHQAGFDTAVAACGTALTPEQVKMLGEYADEVVLCYDSDEAGQKATARSLGLFADSPLKVTVLNLSGAKDPDEYIKKFGRERFEQLLNGANNALEYKLARVRSKYDLAQPAGRIDYIKDAINLLAGHVTPTERDVYAGRLAEETDVAKGAILNQLDAAIKQKRRRDYRKEQQDLLNQGVAAQIKVPYTLGGQKALGVANAEQQLVTALLKDPGYISQVAQRIQPDNLLMPEIQQIYSAILQCHRQGIRPDLSVLGPMLPEQQLNLLSQLLARNADITITAEDLEMFMTRIERSLPKSSQAAQMDQDELSSYLEKLRNRKQ